MIFEFITKNDANGNHKYLKIDPDKREYTTLSPKMIDSDCIVLRTKDIKELQRSCELNGFKFKWTE